MDELIAALERVAEAARVWCRNPRSPAAQQAVSRALDELEEYEEAVEPITQVTHPEAALKVRAAVAVVPGGRYSIHGSSEEPDDHAIRNHVYARLCHIENCTVHFIEAVVPVAVPLTVPAEVEEGVDDFEITSDARPTEPARAE